MEADLLEMQCAVLAALREVTGASAAGVRPYLYTYLNVVWCYTGACLQAAMLVGPCVCHVLLQQSRAAGLAQLQVVDLQHAAMLVESELHVVLLQQAEQLIVPHDQTCCCSNDALGS